MAELHEQGKLEFGETGNAVSDAQTHVSRLKTKTDDNIDRSAIHAMKRGLLRIYEELREFGPTAKLSDRGLYKTRDLVTADNREQLLNALGTVASFSEAKLDSGPYIENLKDNIAMLSATPDAQSQESKPTTIREKFDTLKAANPEIQAGLNELSALIESKEQKQAIAR